MINSKGIVLHRVCLAAMFMVSNFPEQITQAGVGEETICPSCRLHYQRAKAEALQTSAVIKSQPPNPD
jgi:hypothetical protein